MTGRPPGCLLAILICLVGFPRAIPAETVAERTARLHRESLVFDAHVHFMNRQIYLGGDIGDRPPGPVGGVGVDLPSAREGGLKALFFNLYVEGEYAPARYEVKQTLRLVDGALEQIRKNKDKVELALDAGDVERISRSGKIAAVIDLEGSFDMDGDSSMLRTLYRLGVRGIQVADNARNTSYADSACCAPTWKGINDRGRALIREANRLGMVINLAHASDDTWLQVVEYSQAPVISSHQGLRHFNPGVAYNAGDEMIRKLVAKGGVVGMHFSPTTWSLPFYEYNRKAAGHDSAADATTAVSQTFEEITSRLRFNTSRVSPLAPREVIEPTSRWTNVVEYYIRLVGEDHLALGSDFGGGLRDRAGLTDISQYPAITRALVERGYSDERIRKILGLNLLRVFREISAKASH